MPFVPRGLDEPHGHRDGPVLGLDLSLQFLDAHAVAIRHGQELSQHLPAQPEQAHAVINRDFPLACRR